MAEHTSWNQSIDRMFRIIETMTLSGKPMRLHAIAEKSNVAPSTAMRILNAMIEQGYALQNQETQLYSLSYKFLWIGNSIRENLSLNQLIHPYLQEITRRTGLSSALAILNGNSVTYVDEVISTHQMLRVYHHLGLSFPLYSNACGKLFLSNFSRQELNRYFQHVMLEPFTPKTLCTREELEKDLKTIQATGYAVNDEEDLLGMRCVSLPLNSSDGHVFACLTISGTIYQIPSDSFPVFASTMQNVVAKLYDECGPVFSQLITEELL